MLPCKAPFSLVVHYLSQLSPDCEQIVLHGQQTIRVSERERERDTHRQTDRQTERRRKRGESKRDREGKEKGKGERERERKTGRVRRFTDSKDSERHDGCRAIRGLFVLK